MKKRALLIGINEYKYYREYPLDGCINDVEIIASVLREKFGFSEDEITLLKDKEATRDRIVEEMRRILETCEPDAPVVLHFSGHGTRRIARETTKPDGLEETIVPYDSPTDIATHRDIYDSDLRDWIALLAKITKNICFFCDSCYAGSIVRGEKIRGVETDSLLSSAEVKKAASKMSAENLFPRSSVNWLELSESYVLLAGCKKDEFAREYTVIEGDKKTPFGAFTYFLAGELRNAPENATYQDVFEQVCIKMGLRTTSQHPQIEGRNERQLFTGIQTETLQYISIKERTGDEVILLAGASHGITIGSQWGVFEPEAIRQLKPKKIGTVKISQIDVVTSRAKIIKESKNSEIKAGDKAVEEVHYYKNKAAKVFLDMPSTDFDEIRHSIAKAVKKSSWLKLTDQATDSDFIVSSIANPEAGNAVPGINKIVILQTHDHAILWSGASADKDYHKKVCRTLETLVKFAMVTELQNSVSRLKDLVKFELLQKNKGKWKKAEPRYNNLPLFSEGEQIAFQVTNLSPVPIYISVLDLGLTKRISLLYPRRAASEKLEKTRSGGGFIENPNLGKLSVGILPNERINLFIPDEARITALPDINRNGGVEVFKLMITTEQTNFSWIEQSGLRTRIRSKSPLDKLMRLYFKENRTREGNYELDEENDWFTINRTFYLCKK
ncbi:MAG: caspase family protein [Pyrinomonadaceae bacterium]|nr:caspase family protein [Pyrinomonadaceae bacterium]